jgi:hypothetical protein
MVRNESSKLPKEIIVEPAQVGNPGIHIARVVSDVFIKEGLQFTKVKGLPEREEVESGEVNHVVDNPGIREEAEGIPSSRRSQERGEGMMSFYCILEVIDTSIDNVEIGKNVKLGDGEPLESWEVSVAESHVYGNMKVASGKGGARVRDDQETSHAELTRDIEHKLGHLENTERDVLIPVMREYHDLFKYDRSGMLPCMSKAFN